MAEDALDATHSRVFHVLEVCKVIGAHKQALANHACVRSSLKAMSASVHEAEVLLNAAPTAIDSDDLLGRRTCIPDDDPRVEAIVSMMQQQEGHKALISLKNLTAERYWESRWQREWETKYHDPLLGIKRQEQEFVALGGLDTGMQRRRAQRVRAALKDRESRPEFDPIKRARERAQEFVSRRRRGPIEDRALDGRPRTAFGKTNKPVAVAARKQHSDRSDSNTNQGEAASCIGEAERPHGRKHANGRRRSTSNEKAGVFCDVEGDRSVPRGQPERGATAGPLANRSRTSRCHTAGPGGATRGYNQKRPKSTFSTCPRFPVGPGWDENYTARALARLAKVDPSVFDYTEGALDSV
ncbi:unnamed protein product, partial [Scytosiphon promiscuus]